jgi:hypothetical protein
MKIEDFIANPEVSIKLENLIAQGIETLNKEHLAISNGLHAIYALAFTNGQINWILNYLESNPSKDLNNSLDNLYSIKNQCLQMIKQSIPYLPNYLESL